MRSTARRRRLGAGDVDASFLTFEVGLILDEAMRPGVRRQLDGIAQALAPYDEGRQYLNFTEAQTDPARFYRPEAYERLRAVKQRVDPDEVFRATTRSGRPAGSAGAGAERLW